MTLSSALSTEFTNSLSFSLSSEQKKKDECIWKIEQTRPFDECILSWNGYRPKKGSWSFQVSLKQENRWSPWIQYAKWASNSQSTFKYAEEGSWIESYQDAVYPKNDQCTGFQVKVIAEEGATLETFDTLHICLSSISTYTPMRCNTALPSILLPNPPRKSQMQLNHPRARDLCSPTATSTAINYLLKSNRVDPIAFAAKIHDDAFDIYGNWILNTAQAYEELGGRFYCQVSRLNDFSSLHSRLMKNLPVVISVRGPLIGSSHPLTFGHLICVVGYDADKQRVLCIDSGFSEDEKTFVGYPLDDFMQGWGRRHQIAYIFTPKDLESSLAKIMQ